MLGVALSAEVLVTRLAFSADHDWVYIFGHPIQIVCALKQHYGIPCPTCGFTRGFVLSMHGDIASAWRLSPSGPLFAIATVLAAIICFAFAVFENRGMHGRIPAFRKWVQTASLIYSVAGIAIWLAAWISVVRGIRPG